VAVRPYVQRSPRVRKVFRPAGLLFAWPSGTVPEQGELD
jgi:hypothetical protein